MALFPLQGIVEGDFVVCLVAVDDTDRMGVVGEKIRAHAVGIRVQDYGGGWRVRVGERDLNDEVTVQEAGLVPLDVVTVLRA